MEHGLPSRSRTPLRSVIPASHVSFGDRPVCVGAAADTPKTPPRIELVREDGVIRAIDITCVCGERVRVLCSYE